MTVKELKQKLEKYPDTMEIFIDERKTDFKYGLANGIRKVEINFMEEPDGEVLSKDVVLIISEE